MVSKTSAQEPKKAEKKPAQKKVSAKAAAPKKTAVKTEVKKVEEKVLNRQIPVKENVNPVEQVLEIKAHNEEKKASKKAAKTVKKTVKTEAAPVEKKENKAAVKRDAVLAVKNSAQQAAVRKLAEMKEDLAAKPKCCCAFGKDGAWAAWARVYKNIFNYKGRTSRYEFWSFMLINLFFALIFGYGASLLLSAYTSLTIGSLYLLVFLIVVILTALSLSVRRIHDTGYSAWNGFYRQLTFSFVALLATVFLTGFVYDTIIHNPSEEESWWLNASATGCLLLLTAFLLIISYYSTKIGIAVAYFESETSDNEYGKVSYNEKCHKMLTLRYAALFCVTVSLLYTLSLVIGIISSFISGTQMPNL